MRRCTRKICGKVENGPLSIVSIDHSTLYYYRWCFSRNFTFTRPDPHPHSYACQFFSYSRNVHFHSEKKEMFEKTYDTLELCESARNGSFDMLKTNSFILFAYSSCNICHILLYGVCVCYGCIWMEHCIGIIYRTLFRFNVHCVRVRVCMSL